MLGGAGAGANISIAMQPANKATFINNLLSVMNQLNYSGIDLDWEDSVTVSGLISLASALRAAKPDIVLSYPGGMINPNIDTVDPNYATLANSLDRFFVQSYYPDTAVAGPGTGWNSWFISPLSGSTANTPIAIDDTLSRYVAVGVPTAKLGMGIAFYAICYTGGVSGPRQSTSSSSIVGGDNNYPLSSFYATGSTYDSAPTGALQFDSIAKSSYLSYTTAVFDSFCNANTRYLSFETPTSIQAKGNFSIANGYGGIIIWNLNEGYISGSAHPNLLTQALKTAFIDPAGTTTTSTVSTSSSSSAATTTTKSPTTTTATTSHPTTSTTSTTTTGGGSSGAVFIHHSWGLLALACFVVLAFNFIC
jgi:chitinase